MKKKSTVSVGNISVSQKHLNDPMVQMLLKANQNKEIKGMQDIANLIKGGQEEEDEWEEVDEWSEEEEATAAIQQDKEESMPEPLVVDIASRAKENFLKKNLFSKLNYTCMPDRNVD